MSVLKHSDIICCGYKTRMSRDRDLTQYWDWRGPLVSAVMAKGIYPPMTVPDILASLAAWGINVSQEQLARPSQDFVEGLYCACLRQATELDHDLLKGPIQEILDASQMEEKVKSCSCIFCHVIIPFYPGLIRNCSEQ